MHTKTGAFFFHFMHSFPLSKPGVQITHNATQTLRVPLTPVTYFLKDLHNASPVERFDD